MLGERRLHLHNFVLFLVLCVGIAAALVAVFMATERPARVRDTAYEKTP